MPLTEKDKSYFYKKIVALRKAAQALEEELGYEAPVLQKRSTRKQFREQLESTVPIGTWRKPEHLRKTRR